MTVRELKDVIESLPDEAEVVIYADHGQHFEYASETCITRDEMGIDLESVRFEFDNFDECYDHTEDYPVDGRVTGVVIFGD